MEDENQTNQESLNQVKITHNPEHKLSKKRRKILQKTSKNIKIKNPQNYENFQQQKQPRSEVKIFNLPKE